MYISIGFNNIETWILPLWTSTEVDANEVQFLLFKGFTKNRIPDILGPELVAKLKLLVLSPLTSTVASSVSLSRITWHYSRQDLSNSTGHCIAYSFCYVFAFLTRKPCGHSIHLRHLCLQRYSKQATFS